MIYFKKCGIIFFPQFLLQYMQLHGILSEKKMEENEKNRTLKKFKKIAATSI